MTVYIGYTLDRVHSLDNYSICSGYGPARALEGFELPIGTYTLRFKNSTDIDEYILTANDSTVIVNPPDESSYSDYYENY